MAYVIASQCTDECHFTYTTYTTYVQFFQLTKDGVNLISLLKTILLKVVPDNGNSLSARYVAMLTIIIAFAPSAIAIVRIDDVGFGQFISDGSLIIAAASLLTSAAAVANITSSCIKERLVALIALVAGFLYLGIGVSRYHYVPLGVFWTFVHMVAATICLLLSFRFIVSTP